MSLITSLLQPVSKIIEKAVPDIDLQRKLAQELATLAEKQAHEQAMAQIKVLQEDAKGNWFQSSWRPLIGWICGVSLAVNYLVSPICAGFGIIIPQADMSVMMPLLFGMLGIAGMRSFDKTKKIDTKK
tara:strand:- start:5132 stop:5515 length:384 start_codon:yes stop_codon:yes gene_type:complete